MRRHRSHFSARFAFALLALATLSLSGKSIAEQSFLDRFDVVNNIASTVPANGDVNPYGVAVVPRSVGVLKRGSILVSNFNNDVNLPAGQQGRGTTIVQISPGGSVSLFAQIAPASVAGKCSGVGLTTALVVLRRGWVIVGSLPTTDGTSATMTAGCLIVLNSQGHVVETFQGGDINGPWDMTALDEDSHAWLFVTNVLNGNVANGTPGTPIDQGTVVRIPLAVPNQGEGMPIAGPMTVIGSDFPETADPGALVIGPTGVGLGRDGTLYVADTFDNQIVAIPNALTRQTTAFTGVTVTMNGALMNPLGLAIAPNGHIITANAGDGNLVETTPGGQQVAVKTVDTVTGAGSLFGVAIVPDGEGVYFVDDGDNTLKVFESSKDQNENDDDQGDD